MVDAIPVKNKIIEIINAKGPSLPIQIAKATNMNSLFISAFLSELYGDKRVKMSSLKVGGSPLYFLEGQEEQLEKFYNYLHPKEAEAFLMLKQNKILKDSEQDPAIRVALRSIKDFAVNFRKDNEIYWRYLQFPESEVITLLSEEAPKEIKKIEIQNEPEEKEETELKSLISTEISKSRDFEPIPALSKETEPTIQEPKEEIIKKIKKKEIKPIEQEEEFQNPLVIKPIEKPKKEKEKSEFVLKVIKLLEKNNFEILEEKEFKAKEYNCIVKINSDLGPINFLTQAKEKKSISDSDLKTLLSESQKIPLSALMLHTGELNKKAKEYAEKYSSILKTKRIM
jgi:hypothetical protein